jgi:hypothetical protein
VYAYAGELNGRNVSEWKKIKMKIKNEDGDGDERG